MTRLENNPISEQGIFCVLLLSKVKCLKRYSLNLNTSIFKTRHTLIFIFFTFITAISLGQTTFTESATAYNLDIGGGKDGGHGWGDYDLDGDFDLVVNTNGAGYLLRNDGGTFTDVTATLCPEISTGNLERTALFIDLNNDGYPDIVRNDSNFLKIYLQIPNADPTLIRFGLSNGTAANQTFDDPAFGGDFNSEGTGAIDFDGDGDLDIFVENHNYGIDILENDGNGFFTHATVKPPGYNVLDPATWPLGLVQDAVDGDYGAITDFNNDGWVDIVARKQGQVDLFTNLGGIFQDGVDIDDAANGNKGAVAFFDFDNDTDFDLFWTENGDNQIHRNNGDGTWTALGAATGIPVSYSGTVEGLACGDVDNDGDIDIFIAGNNNDVNKLFLNQLTDTGVAMTFVDSGLTFSNTSGEGATFIDIDQDGDLDLYTNRSGDNRLFINDLSATPQGNHLYVDITEDRDAFGLINTEQRFGIGATARLLDCNGNDLLGIREVNGGQGHGTMGAGRLHFGLPAGDNIEYVLEVAYARTTSGRVVIQRRITPSSFFNGSINLINVLPSDPTDGPSAIDDDITTSENTAVNFDPLADNGNGVDFDSGGNSITTISITQPIFGTAVLEVDGTITYTPPAGFTGTTLFSYTIESGTALCTVTDEGTVNITVTSSQDSDGDGLLNSVDLDDDNDGILDTEECGVSVLWVTQGTASTEEQNTIDKLTALGYIVTVVDDNVGGNANDYDVTFVFEDASSVTTFANVANLTTTTNGVILSENALHDEVLGAPSGGSSNTNFVNIINNTHPITSGFPLGNLDIGDATFHSSSLASGTVLGSHPPSGEVSLAVWEIGDAMDVGTAPGRRAIVPHANSNGGFNAIGEDILVNAIRWTASHDTDLDGIEDCLDLDSDNDGIYDAVEAGHGQPHINGRVNSAVGTDGVPDAVQGPGQQNSGTINYTLLDSDSDGNFDYQDRDSDGDGCSDADEAYFPGLTDADPDDDGLYGSGTPTVNTNGEVAGASYASINSYYLSSDVSTCEDNDADLVPDGADLDDDNDGILDTDECDEVVISPFSISSGASNSFNIASTDGMVLDITSLDNNFNIEINGTLLAPQDIEFSRSGSTFVAGDSFPIFVSDGNGYGEGGIPGVWTLNFNNSNPSFVQIRLIIGQSGDVILLAKRSTGSSFEEMVIDPSTPQFNTITWNTNGNNAIVVSQLNTSPPTFLYASASGCSDTDGDGIPNTLDLDSDGDGCSDAIEAGFTDPDADDILGNSPVTVDADGLVTSQGGYLAPADLYGNGTLDFLEVGPDSNGNSIADGCEADLELTKTVDNSAPNIGDTITFTLTIVSNGPSQVSGILIQDALPAGLASIVATPSVGSYNIGTGIWNLNTVMNSGDIETLTISAEVTPLCGTITNTAEIIAASLTDLDSTPNNGG